MSIRELEPPARSASRIIASNTAWRLIAFGARTVSGLAATIAIARLEGPKGLGQFQFALTLTLLLSFLVMLGLPKLLVRELARHPANSRTWVDSAMFVCSLCGLAVTFVLFVVGEVVGVDATMGTLLVTGGFALTVDAMARVEMSLFWSSERMQFEAATVCVQEGAFLIGTLALLAAGFGVVGVMVAYMASRVFGLWMAWVICAWKLRVRLWPRPHRDVVRPMLRKAVPFAADDGLSLAYIRLDAVLLGFFKGSTAVGLYQSATNLVLYLNILPRMLNLSLYPRMSRAWPDRVEELARLRDASLRLLGAIAMPIAVGSLLLAPEIFRMLYGNGFDDAVVCYQLLALVIPIRMLGNTLGTTLTSADGQAKRTWAVGIAAGMNVLLNLYFIPRYSYIGAAITTLITETGLFVGYAVMLRRIVGPSHAATALLVPGIACVPLALTVFASSEAPLPVVLVLAAGVYVIALFAVAMVRMPRPTFRLRSVVVSFLQGSA